MLGDNRMGHIRRALVLVGPLFPLAAVFAFKKGYSRQLDSRDMTPTLHRVPAGALLGLAILGPASALFRKADMGRGWGPPTRPDARIYPLGSCEARTPQ